MANYKKPTIHKIPNPINLDAGIEAIQNKLSNIPWLETIYARAFILPGSEEGRPKHEPKAYVGQKGYASVMPNDNVTANSFFYVTSPERTIDYNNLSNKQKKEVDISIIFWWNYKKIDKTKDYLFLEEIKKQIETELKKCKSLAIVSVVDNDARDIWREFDITELGNELLLYPCGAIRYNTNLSFISLCP